MIMATVVDTVRVDICTDCLMWHHGYGDDVVDPAVTHHVRWDNTVDLLERESAGHLTVSFRDPDTGKPCECRTYGTGCGCSESFFSPYPCEWCGDLPGDRYAVVITLMA